MSRICRKLLPLNRGSKPERKPILCEPLYIKTHGLSASPGCLLQNKTNLNSAYTLTERTQWGSLAAGLTVARAEFVGMQFAAGRPILAVIFLDEHRDPFTAHIERFRDCAL